MAISRPKGPEGEPAAPKQGYAPPAEPRGRRDHFDVGSTNDATPWTAPDYKPISATLDQFVMSGNAMAAGPSGASRRLIGMGTFGEFQSPNGMSSGTYDSKLNAMTLQAT